MTKKVYVNKNGNMEVEDFVELIHKGKLDIYMRKFRVSDDQCPPMKLISNDVVCFYCKSCHDQCKAKVKEYKTYYQVGRDKFMKVEF